MMFVCTMAVIVTIGELQTATPATTSIIGVNQFQPHITDKSY